MKMRRLPAWWRASLRHTTLFDESLMPRHGCGGLARHFLDVADESAQALERHRVYERIVPGGRDPLTEHDSDPTVLAEEILRVLKHAPVVPEQLDFLLQGIRDLQITATAPKRRVVALGCLVVQDDEVSYPTVLVRHIAVIGITRDSGEAAVGKEREESRDANLYQMDTRGLERLNESAGQPEGHTVPFPELVAVPGLEFQDAGLGERCRVELGQEASARGVIT